MRDAPDLPMRKWLGPALLLFNPHPWPVEQVLELPASRRPFAGPDGPLPLQRGRTCQLTRVREAQTLLVLLQDRKGFEAALSEVIAFDASRAPEWAPENLAAQREARELLARRDRLLGP